MHKDIDIDRKQLPCDMLYSGKNKIEARRMSRKSDTIPDQRTSRKKKVQQYMFPGARVLKSRPALWRNKAVLLHIFFLLDHKVSL